jgi:hypothetical protein
MHFYKKMYIKLLDVQDHLTVARPFQIKVFVHYFQNYGINIPEILNKANLYKFSRDN